MVKIVLVIDFLNARLSVYSSSIFDGMRIFVSPVKEQKTKTVSKISISVEPSIYPFEGWSSGEKSRVDLVLEMALLDLFNVYRGFVNIFAVDEFDKSLDGRGLDNLVTMLDTISEGRCVFLVSHNNALKNMVSNRIVVRKINGVSSVEV